MFLTQSVSMATKMLCTGVKTIDCIKQMDIAYVIFGLWIPILKHLVCCFDHLEQVMDLTEKYKGTHSH